VTATAARRVGIDVGGTKCLGVALGPDGDVLDQRRVPTPNDPEALVETLVAITEALGADGAVGIAVPGLVNRDGVLLAAPNLTRVTMLPLRDLVAARSGLRVVVDNDNTVACLAEWLLGAGRGCDDMVLVGLGTGIGGGFVSGGRLQRGHHRAASAAAGSDTPRAVGWRTWPVRLRPRAAWSTWSRQRVRSRRCAASTSPRRPGRVIPTRWRCSTGMPIGWRWVW
jgi:predicted NBD/HSP70 family sugar kinase